MPFSLWAQSSWYWSSENCWPINRLVKTRHFPLKKKLETLRTFSNQRRINPVLITAYISNTRPDKVFLFVPPWATTKWYSCVRGYHKKLNVTELFCGAVMNYDRMCFILCFGKQNVPQHVPPLLETLEEQSISKRRISRLCWEAYINHKLKFAIFCSC